MSKKFVIYVKKNLIKKIIRFLPYNFFIKFFFTHITNFLLTMLYFCHCHYTVKYRGAAHKEISVVFHNGSTYDYHFIIKELVKDFDENFECLGKNTEK